MVSQQHTDVAFPATTIKQGTSHMDDSALKPATEQPTTNDAGTPGLEDGCTNESNGPSTSMAASTSVSHHDGLSLHDGPVLEQDHPDGDEIRRQVCVTNPIYAKVG